MKKRALYWILSILVVLSCIGMVACGKKSSEPEVPPQDAPKVTLSQESVELGYFDTYVLVATTENTGTSTVEWTSSNTDVVTVANGKLTPKSVGTAVITATCGSASATCNVTVTAPTDIEAVVDFTKLELKVGADAMLQPKAWYDGGNDYLEGGVFTFTNGANTNVAEVDANGKVTAKAAGTQTVTIGGTIYGFNMVSTTLNIVVSNDLTVEIAETAALELGDPAKKTLTLAPVFTLNGATVDASALQSVVAVSSKDNIVSVDGMTITAEAVGAATITITATAADGTVGTAEIVVSVAKTVVNLPAEQEIIIELSEGTTLNIAELGVAGEITSIMLGDAVVAEEQYTLTEGVLAFNKGVKLGENMETIFESATTVYTVKLTVVTKVVESAADLDWLADNATIEIGTFGNAKTATGANYIIVTADIDYEMSEKWASIGLWDNNGYALDGTFNGRGHTIRRMVLKNGFLQTVSKNSVLENLAIVDTEFRGSGTGGALINRSNYGIIRNIYLQGYMTTGHAGAYIHSGLWSNEKGAVLQNIVVNLYNRHFATNAAAQNFCTYQEGSAYNVKVISDITEGFKVSANASEANEGNANYTSVAEFMKQEDQAALLELFGEYWTITDGGALVFKSAKQYLKSTNPTTTFTVAAAQMGAGTSEQFETAAPAYAWKVVGENIEGISVDANGIVTVAETVAVGTTFKVEAYINDRDLGLAKGAETEVTIVSEALKVAPIENVTLDAVSGEGLTNTYTVSASLTINGVAATPASVTAQALTEGVVSVSGTTITAVAAGTTEILVTVTSAAGNSKTARFTVTVQQVAGTFAATGEVIVDLNSDRTIEGMNGVVIGFKPADGEYGAIGAVKGENLSGTVYTGTHYYDVANVTIVDVVIKDTATMAAYGAKIKNAAKVEDTAYGILANSFTWDASLGDWTTMCDKGSASFMYLNGRGYTIDGMKTRYGIIHTLAASSVVKNIAFTNVTLSTYKSALGDTGHTISGTLENVYYEMTSSGNANAECTAFFTRIFATAVIRDVVVIATGRSTGSVVNNIGSRVFEEGAVVDNLHVVAVGQAGTTGFLYGEVAEGGYTTINQFKNKTSEEGFMDAFDSNWMLLQGIPTFKTAEASYAVTATVEGAESIKQGEAGAYTLSGATASKWDIAETVEGVSISGAIVNIGEAVAVGTTFTVRAYVSSKVLGEYVIATKTVTVALQDKPLNAIPQQDELIVDLSDATAKAIDIVALGIEGEVTKIKVNGAELTADDYTLTEGKLVVKGFNGADVAFEIHTATARYTFKATLADIVIDSVEDLDAFFTNYNKTWGRNPNAPYAFYVVMTADVDAATLERDADNTTKVDWHKDNNPGGFAGYWAGHFDGRGHTIANLNVDYSLIGQRIINYGSIKNVAFVGLVKEFDNTVGILGNSLHTGTLENVYVQGEIKTYMPTSAATWYWHDKNGVANNVIVNLTVADNYAKPAWGGKDGVNYYGTFNNLYVIINASNGYLRGDNENCTNPSGVYATVAAFLEGVDEAALVEAFGEYWTLANGVPVFKSAAKYLAPQGAIEGAATITQNSHATYTATGVTVTKWDVELPEELVGKVTVNEEGVVNVAVDAAPEAKFVVKAYANSVALGEYVAATKEVTVEKIEEVVNITAIENKTIYMVEEGEYKASVTVTPEVTLDGEPMTEGIVLSTNSDVINIEGYVISAAKAGTATVTVTATTALGTVQTATFTVTVLLNPVAVENPEERIIDMNTASTLSWDVTGMTTDEIVAVKVGGAAQTGWSFAEGTITFAKEFARGEYLDVVFETATHAYTVGNLTFVDFNIYNTETLVAFANAIRDKSVFGGYVINTASFTSTDTTHAWANATDSELGGQNWIVGLKWNGRFNTINNLEFGPRGLFWGIEQGAWIKNIAFTNTTTKKNRSSGGSLMYGIEPGTYVENIYYEVCDDGGYGAATNTGCMTAVKAGASIKNVVGIAWNRNNGDAGSNIGFQTMAGTLNNVHIVSVSNRTHSNYLYGEVTEGGYKTVAALQEAAAAEGFMTAFGEGWKLVNGIPMFATAEQFYFVKGTVSGDDTIQQTFDATYTLSGATAIRWEVKGDDLTGISIDATTGKVTVAVNATAGAVFTVEAYAKHGIVGEYLAASKNVTVEEVPEVVAITPIEDKYLYLVAEGDYATSTEVVPSATLNGEAMTEGVTMTTEDTAIINISDNVITAVAVGTATVKVTATAPLGTSQTITFKVIVAKTPVAIANTQERIFELSDESTTSMALSEMGISEEIVAVRANGKLQPEAAYAIEEGVLTVKRGSVTLGEFMTISLESATKSYNVPNITIVTKVVENKADMDWLVTNALEEIGALADEKVNTGKNYIIFTADIDYEMSENWASIGLWGSNFALDGVMNGRGHTIRRMVLKNGFLQTVSKNSVLENLAIVDTEFRGSGTGGALVNRANRGIIRNMYLQGYMTTTAAGAYVHSGLWSNEAAALIENVLIRLTARSYATNAKAQNFCTYQEGVCKNVKVITDIDEGWAVTNRAQTGTENNNVYNGNAAFLAAENADSLVALYGDYWTKDADGIPVFKTSIVVEDDEPVGGEETPVE